jgi:hypothetical protein
MRLRTSEGNLEAVGLHYDIQEHTHLHPIKEGTIENGGKGFAKCKSWRAP